MAVKFSVVERTEWSVVLMGDQTVEATPEQLRDLVRSLPGWSWASGDEGGIAFLKPGADFGDVGYEPFWDVDWSDQEDPYLTAYSWQRVSTYTEPISG